MLSQKLCEPLFLYKWNLYDHLTDVSIDDSGSHIRELYKLKLKAFLGYFLFQWETKLGFSLLWAVSYTTMDSVAHFANKYAKRKWYWSQL